MDIIKLFMIDDEPDILKNMSKFLKKSEDENYKFSITAFVADAENEFNEAVRMVDQNDFDVVLTDLRMLNGHKGLNILDAVRDKSSYVSALLLSSFLNELTENDINNYHLQNNILDKNTSPDKIKKAIIEAFNKKKKMEEESDKKVDELATSISLNNPELKYHSLKVSLYSGKIAQSMKKTNFYVKNIKKIALIHDIGMIYCDLPTHNNPFNFSEKRKLRTHPSVGYNYLTRFKPLAPYARTVLHHHVRFDGNNGHFSFPSYPDLKPIGVEIPEESRIIAVADAFDSLTSRRDYRRGNFLSREGAVEKLRQEKGHHDPEILEILERLIVNGAL